MTPNSQVLRDFLLDMGPEAESDIIDVVRQWLHERPERAARVLQNLTTPWTPIYWSLDPTLQQPQWTCGAEVIALETRAVVASVEAVPAGWRWEVQSLDGYVRRFQEVAGSARQAMEMAHERALDEGWRIPGSPTELVDPQHPDVVREQIRIYLYQNATAQRTVVGINLHTASSSLGGEPR